jgi:polyphosphate kinase
MSDFVLLEDVISSRLSNLFGGFDIECWTTFRITRDNDIELLEQESDDMLRLIEERLKARQQAEAVRLEVAEGADSDLLKLIIDDESLRVAAPDDQQTYNEVYPIPGPLDLTALMAMTKGPGRDNLRVEPFIPQSMRGVRWGRGADFFATIARQDILLHHPYDSFEPVAEFIRRAASDPNVLAIKQTLYRAGGDSPIIRSLMEAAEHGKHVTALVELKARFDEEANVSWARQLERSGVHVVFGFLDLKTHCKLSMVIRQEGDRVRRYVHLGTGNYNSVTAQQYTDLGLFTADEDMAADASALFNLLTGYSQGHVYRKLVVAPQNLHARTIELIEEQARRARMGKKSWIFAKLNALADYRVIEALYRASQAGVPIDLIVRGICCLRPGMPGISETIRVRSIVDRFLEHSRIFVFNPPEESPRIFLSSADWMPRNFYRRVEVMFPIEAPPLRQRILTEIIPAYLADNVKARELAADGTYHRVGPGRGKKTFRCQQELLRAYPMGHKTPALSQPPVANGRVDGKSNDVKSDRDLGQHHVERSRRTKPASEKKRPQR